MFVKNFEACILSRYRSCNDVTIKTETVRYNTMYLIGILSETKLRYDISVFTKNTSKWIYKLLQSKIVINFCLLNLSSYYQFI